MIVLTANHPCRCQSRDTIEIRNSTLYQWTPDMVIDTWEAISGSEPGFPKVRYFRTSVSA